MKSHMMTHTGEKTHSCSQCEKQFLLSQSLKAHIKANHTMEIQRQKCDQCNKWLTNAQCLRKHQQIHSVRVLHKCACCQMSFREVKTLRNHTKRHTQDTLLLCTLCPKSFRWNQSLKKHIIEFMLEQKIQIDVLNNLICALWDFFPF